MKFNNKQRDMLITLYQRYKDAKVNNGFSEVVLENEFITSTKIQDPSINELSISDLNEIDEWFEKVIRFGGSINFSLSEDEIIFRQIIKSKLEMSNKSLISIVEDADVDFIKSNNFWKHTTFTSIVISIIFLVATIILHNQLNHSKIKISKSTNIIVNLNDSIKELSHKNDLLRIRIDNLNHIMYLNNSNK
jgi:hypothetical protein